jgi:CRP-like cAMP-binding protein
MTLERVLESNHFVSGFSPPQVAKLASLARKDNFLENDLILMAGEKSSAFYVLLSGSASVEVKTAFYTVRVQGLACGDAFGWSSLLDGYDTLFQVRACEPCDALCIDGATITSLCREDPEFGVTLLRRVLETVAGRIYGLESRLAQFCGFPQAVPEG